MTMTRMQSGNKSMTNPLTRAWSAAGTMNKREGIRWDIWVEPEGCERSHSQPWESTWSQSMTEQKLVSLHHLGICDCAYDVGLDIP